MFPPPKAWGPNHQTKLPNVGWAFLQPAKDLSKINFFKSKNFTYFQKFFRFNIFFTLNYFVVIFFFSKKTNYFCITC